MNPRGHNVLAYVRKYLCMWVRMHVHNQLGISILDAFILVNMYKTYLYFGVQSDVTTKCKERGRIGVHIKLGHFSAIQMHKIFGFI